MTTEQTTATPPADPLTAGAAAIAAGTPPATAAPAAAPTPPVTAPAPAAAAPVRMPGMIGLPTKRTPKRPGFASKCILLYGRPKIGKSTFSSRFDGAVFLPTEPGLGEIECYQMPDDGTGIQTWEQLCQAIAILAEVDPKTGTWPHPFRTIVIDTVDNAWKLVENYICRRKGAETIGAVGSKGAGYALAASEFERVVRKMMQIGFGVVLISHVSESQELDPISGAEINRVVPSITRTGRKIVTGLADMILFAEVIRETSPDGKNQTFRRILRTTPMVGFDCGTRGNYLPPITPLDYEQFSALYLEGEAAVKAGKRPAWQQAIIDEAQRAAALSATQAAQPGTASAPAQGGAT